MRGSRVADLLATATLAVGSMVIGMAPSIDPVVRLPFALALVVLLPGYALTAAVFARRPIGGAETVALSVGLSLALSALAGIVLNLTPWGLTAGAWAVFLGGATCLLCVIAAIRRRREGWLGYDIRFGPVVPDRRGFVPVILFVIAVTIGAAAIAVAQEGARLQPRPGFTQLWLLAGSEDDVTLGIHNAEDASIDVRLVVTRGSSVIADIPSVEVARDETWQRSIPVPDAQTGDQPIVARLFRPETPDAVFREARLWPE